MSHEATATYRVEVAQRGRLDAALSASVPDLSRARIAALIKDGSATVDGEVCTRPAQKVAPGSIVVLAVPPPAPSEAVAQDLPLDIVYQDADVVVVDKAAGMVVHPGAGHPDGTLVNALLHHVGDLSGIGGVERPGIVHRLDRGTSGLLVVAKHDQAHRALSSQFADHSAQRTYLALVHGAVPVARGTIESQLARHPTQRTRFASTDSGGKRAVTHWWRLAQRGTVSVVRCQLETGRTHQIRVHLCEAGWPLLGDGLYRRRHTRVPASLSELVDPAGSRPLLHAARLRFRHPGSGDELCFDAPLPDDFRAALRALELDSDLDSLL